MEHLVELEIFQMSRKSSIHNEKVEISTNRNSIGIMRKEFREKLNERIDEEGGGESSIVDMKESAG